MPKFHNLYVTAETHERIKAIAAQEQRSISVIIARMVDAYLHLPPFKIDSEMLGGDADGKQDA